MYRPPRPFLTCSTICYLTEGAQGSSELVAIQIPIRLSYSITELWPFVQVKSRVPVRASLKVCMDSDTWNWHSSLQPHPPEFLTVRLGFWDSYELSSIRECMWCVNIINSLESEPASNFSLYMYIYYDYVPRVMNCNLYAISGFQLGFKR